MVKKRWNEERLNGLILKYGERKHPDLSEGYYK